eukprot:CAMPEP_0114618186 /NCGR_PEP_ID=MMETSP0168-20121206/7576_1 /TAXON_ID=95228 ORGANISM="Vannella sp., Strain DIVA3 517/6/12" /NCGR_SAMPLE_ID=MMETSP0168 /ASSEMBLY_ACC=CAM_ASM_000044 /LENGTH=348 /DNA_ID=CAMNT_0001829331 /DNA_START=59 /DNA_END=1102 /DNA_ORIENTATION=+
MAEKGRSRQKAGGDSAPRLAVNPRSGSVWQLPSAGLKAGSSTAALEAQASGAVGVNNGRISRDKEDVLYHLGLSSGMDLEGMFGDVKFVCMGGSAARAESLAKTLLARLNVQVPTGYGLAPIGKVERYSLFKVGPVISVNHGMGMPSMSILLHEVTKLLFHAKATDVTYIRIGTSGGLGLEGGTVVVAKAAVDSGTFKPIYKHRIMGKEHEYPSHLDERLAQAALECAKGDGSAEFPEIPCVIGNTLGTDDFYEGQGRCDGCICEYTEEDKMAWLQQAYDAGVRNIEMESTLFACFCNRMKIPAMLINTVLLNRLNGDQVTASADELSGYSKNSQEVALRVITSRLAT